MAPCATPTTPRRPVCVTPSGSNPSGRLRKRKVDNEGIIKYFPTVKRDRGASRKLLDFLDPKPINVDDSEEFVFPVSSFRTPTTAALPTSCCYTSPYKSSPMTSSVGSYKQSESKNLLNRLSSVTRNLFLYEASDILLAQLARISTCLAKVIWEYYTSAVHKKKLRWSLGAALQSERVNIINKFGRAVRYAVNKLDHRVRLIVGLYRDLGSDLPDYDLWGRFFLKVIRYWRPRSVEKIVSEFVRVGLLDPSKLIVQRGTSEELQLRSKLRGLFAEGIIREHREDRNWMNTGILLSSLLRTMNTISDQGQLLLTIFNPIADGSIDWQSNVDNPAVNWQESEHRIKPIALAVASLFEANKRIHVKPPRWTGNDIFSLVEEISTYPTPWSLENFVLLLLHERPLFGICVGYRIVNNYNDEAGVLVNLAKQILVRWGMDIGIIDGHIRTALRHLDRKQGRKLLHSIQDAYYNAYRDLCLSGLGGSAAGVAELNAQAVFHPIYAALVDFIGL